MWIWWIISLVVLIACFIFAYRVIVSSYDFLPGDRKNLFAFRKNNLSGSGPEKTEVIWDLKNKLQKVEESATFHEIQFSKLQQRLKVLEETRDSRQGGISIQRAEEEEDWKEMYYEENELKEKLENELDETRQKLEEAGNQLHTISQDNTQWAALQSDHDARLNELQSMQNNIGLLQRQLEAATARERELEQSLLAEAHVRKQYTQLQHDFTRVQSENADLRSQVVDMHKREKDLEGGITRLNELEIKLSTYEEEKARMINDLEQMVNQNKIFSTPRNS
jgi:predicted  nucleic acid-binding Zn-ribbon protein